METKSGIYGLVVGDALGVPVEFKDRDFLEKKPVSEMCGFGTHNVPEGTWSDDSSMTIATMDSIVEKHGIDYYDIMNKFLEWVRSAKYTATGVFFDIGIATRNALNNYLKGFDPIKCGGKGIYDNGNGSLMRILPFVYYSYVSEMSFEDEIAFINNASSLTHAHEISRLGCKIYSDYIKALLDGRDKFEALEYIKGVDYKKYYSKASVNAYRRILKEDLEKIPVQDIKSSGFVVDTLEASIWCNLTENTFEDAVKKAVNLGSDTDTVGAITGSIAGITYGYEQIPERWISKIQNFEYLDYLNEKFVEELRNINCKKNSKL